MCLYIYAYVCVCLHGLVCLCLCLCRCLCVFICVRTRTSTHSTQWSICRMYAHRHTNVHTHAYTHNSPRPSGSAGQRGRGLAADMWPRTRRRRWGRKWEVLLHLPGGGYGTQAWRPSCLSTFTMAIGAYIIACQLRRFSKRQRMQRAMRLRLCGMVMACVFSS
jgi:hypothetical protein